MPDNNSADRDLAGRIVAGDEDGWRILYDGFYERLRSEAFRRLGDLDEAEDAVQETFVRFFRYLSGFDPERNSLRAYLSGILRNICSDIYRRNKERSRRPWSEYTEELTAPEREEPILTEKEKDQFWEANKLFLDRREQEIVTLIRNGLENKEIAAALEKGETSVSSYKCKITKKIQQFGVMTGIRR